LVQNLYFTHLACKKANRKRKVATSPGFVIRGIVPAANGEIAQHCAILDRRHSQISVMLRLSWSLNRDSSGSSMKQSLLLAIDMAEITLL